VADLSRLLLAIWSRQTGKSFAMSFRGIRRCIREGTTEVYLSAGERQSRLLMEKVKLHLEAVKAIEDWIERDFAVNPDENDGKDRVKQLEIRLKNKGVIYGLPANPDTARGYSGHIHLDEFALIKNARKIYSAVYASILRGYTLEIGSTPNGTSGKCYEIAKESGLVPGYVRQADSYWSAHLVDIYTAAMQGLADSVPPPPTPPKDYVTWARKQFAQRFARPATERMVNFVAALRAGEDDDEQWQQEFECVFISDASNYIPMELIIGCQSEEATTDCHLADLKGGSNLYLGVDIGRKRDLTVAWLFEKLGDVLWSKYMLVMKGQSFDAQEKAISDILDIGVRRCAIDQSGIGMMLAEHLVKRYGGVVEAVQFTAQVKEKLAPLTKQGFESRTVRIPDHRDIRNDINAVKRFVTPAGNIRFDAEHTDKGHADRFWALAMVLNAASTPVASLADGRMVGTPRSREFALEAAEEFSLA
jgi:phage FluMu gp28-like protein